MTCVHNPSRVHACILYYLLSLFRNFEADVYNVFGWNYSPCWYDVTQLRQSADDDRMWLHLISNLK